MKMRFLILFFVGPQLIFSQQNVPSLLYWENHYFGGDDSLQRTFSEAVITRLAAKVQAVLVKSADQADIIIRFTWDENSLLRVDLSEKNQSLFEGLYQIEGNLDSIMESVRSLSDELIPFCGLRPHRIEEIRYLQDQDVEARWLELMDEADSLQNRREIYLSAGGFSYGNSDLWNLPESEEGYRPLPLTLEVTLFEAGETMGWVYSSSYNYLTHWYWSSSEGVNSDVPVHSHRVDLEAGRAYRMKRNSFFTNINWAGGIGYWYSDLLGPGISLQGSLTLSAGMELGDHWLLGARVSFALETPFLNSGNDPRPHFDYIGTTMPALMLGMVF